MKSNFIVLIILLVLIPFFTVHAQRYRQKTLISKKRLKLQKKRQKQASKAKDRERKVAGTSVFNDFSTRHFQNMKAVELYGGTTEFGTYAGLSFSRYMTSNSYIKVNGFWERGNVNAIEIRNFGLDLIYNHTILKVSNTIFFNAGGGTTFGYDQILSKEILNLDDELNFGGLLNAEAEVFFTNNIAMVIHANQRFLTRTNFGRQRWFAGIGMKYSF